MKYFLIFILASILIFSLSKEGLAYNVYLKNGKVFDAIEHRLKDGIFIIVLRNGSEVGFPVDDIDKQKTDASIKAFEEQKKREEEAIRRRKELEEKEKGKNSSILNLLTQQGRGMQMTFLEEEVNQLIDYGERNHVFQQDFLKAYSFNNDYLPSVIYTKRLRILLYGVERGKTKKPIVTSVIQSIIQDPHLLLLLVVTGDDPEQFIDAEVFLKQDDAEIKPFNVIIPARGERTTEWPNSPAYFWKILINFRYADINVQKKGTLVLRNGNETREFNIDFSYYR